MVLAGALPPVVHTGGEPRHLAKLQAAARDHLLERRFLGDRVKVGEPGVRVAPHQAYMDKPC